jgi:hypothetical protein
LAFHLWQTGDRLPALGCMLLGGTLGALLIRTTEPRIAPDLHPEPKRVTVSNAVAMPVFMLILVTYLSAAWSAWRTDLLAGAAIGLALALIQDLAARAPFGLRHGLALACAFGLALAGIRLAITSMPALTAGLLVTFVLTLVVTLVDYGQRWAGTSE